MKYVSANHPDRFFALAISPVVTAQAVNKDKERAENERDLELRSWNLRILALQYNRNKRRSRTQPEQQLAQFQKTSRSSRYS
jgi:hypothetical protein